MKAPINKFLYKIFLFSIPIWIIVLFYIVTDPFKVLYNYSTYYNIGDTIAIAINKDYVSTQTLINNSKNYDYNSFIFGNSRSMFWEVNSWKKYIKSDNCFHFDASYESLLGIYRKFIFLNDNKYKVTNALIIFDNSLLENPQERDGHLFIPCPKLSNHFWIGYQLEYLTTFFSPKFLFAFIDFKISGRTKNYMKDNRIFEDKPIDYNLKYNELKFTDFETLINNTPSKFYDDKKMKIFYNRKLVGKSAPKSLSEKHIKMLNEINEILKRNKTNFKFIISPLYDQIKFNESDLAILQNIFGEKNIFDYSGINSITNDYKNYYESAHYRPHIANYILQQVYSQ